MESMNRSENDPELFAQLMKVRGVSRVFWDDKINKLHIRVKPELEKDSAAKERIRKTVNAMRLAFQKGIDPRNILGAAIAESSQSLSASQMIEAMSADDEPTTVPMRPIKNGAPVDHESSVYQMVDDDAPVPWEPPSKKKKKD